MRFRTSMLLLVACIIMMIFAIRLAWTGWTYTAITLCVIGIVCAVVIVITLGRDLDG